MEDEVRRFKQKKLDELREAQAHKDDSPAAKDIWRKAVADIKDIDAAIRGGANTLAELKTALYHNTSIVSEINKELEISEEDAVTKEAVVESEQKSDGGVFSARLEALINSALQDGVLTEQEKNILKKRAEKEGEDWDEVEMIINARLAERQPVENCVEKNTMDEKDIVGTPSNPPVETKIEVNVPILDNPISETMYSEQLEQLIKSVIADGVITEKERAVLHKRAIAEGIDEDEIDVYVDGLIAQMKSETTKSEVPISAKIDFNHVTKFNARLDRIYYLGQKSYYVNNVPNGPIGKLYLNFFKQIIQGDKIYFGISVAFIFKSGFCSYSNFPRLFFKTDTNSIQLRWEPNCLEFPQNLKPSRLKYDIVENFFDEEMLKLLCDAKHVTMSLTGCVVTKDSNDIDERSDHAKEIDIKDISVNGLTTYAQVFYRSVVDNSAYPDAVINDDESSKSKKRNYDISDVDDAMAIRLITGEANKWEIIKPRPGMMDQYKGLKGIVITDIHCQAYFNERRYLKLKALSDKNGNVRFFFIYEGGWWKLKQDLKFTVNMEDHEVRFLQNDDNKYVYEVDASVLKEMFTTSHDILLNNEKLISVPDSRWKMAFEYLTDSNKMKEWLEKYEENEESGIFGKLKNFFGD